MQWRRPFNAIPFALALLTAAGPNGSAQILPFKSYSVLDGLTSNDILGLYQDSQGYLWIATAAGVNVYDGRTFRGYTSADGLPRSTVVRFSEEQRLGKRIIWLVGGQGAVSRYEDGKFLRFSYDTTAWCHEIRSIAQDHAGTLWAGTDAGLGRIVEGQLQQVQTGIPMTFVETIVEQGDSLLWLGYAEGLATYTLRTNRFAQIELPEETAGRISAIVPDDSGAVWVGRGKSIIKIVNDHVASHMRTPKTDFMVDDRRGSFWVGSYDGAHRIEKRAFPFSRIDHFGLENGLKEMTLKVALVDNEGSLWIGGNSEGLVRLSEWGA